MVVVIVYNGNGFVIKRNKHRVSQILVQIVIHILKFTPSSHQFNFISIHDVNHVFKKVVLDTLCHNFINITSIAGS